MSKAVGLNLAALECFEQLTGKKYTEIDSVLSNAKEASISDMIGLVVSLKYGSLYPHGNLEEIQEAVRQYTPEQLRDFFQEALPVQELQPEAQEPAASS
jgi:hypothetical protein